ncbi:MAG: type II toxin-antitoxin system VapC family toxin, partial [Candidatus Dormibacteria bacterium]
MYASNIADPVHSRAEALVGELAAGPDIVYLFWPTIMGYLRLVTHPGILPRPMSPGDALANID